MKKTSADAIHVWLVLNKAAQAITKYAAAGIQQAGLGDSDFRVLEVLLHKGSLPVNTIGPKVNLTPGSISVAVDRLYAKGLVSRVESAEDRRIRIVALTPSGKKLIVPVFRKHTRKRNSNICCGVAALAVQTRAALKTKPNWFGAICSGPAITGAATPIARRSNPSSSAARPHSTMILICNGPRGHRSISPVILTEEDTDISLYPRLQSESGSCRQSQASRQAGNSVSVASKTENKRVLSFLRFGASI